MNEVTSVSNPNVNHGPGLDAHIAYTRRTTPVRDSLPRSCFAVAYDTVVDYLVPNSTSSDADIGISPDMF